MLCAPTWRCDDGLPLGCEHDAQLPLRRAAGIVDSLYADLGPKDAVRRLEVVVAAEAADMPCDLMEIINLLPPGSYTRQRLCDQLNSAIGGHAWGQVYGTVE